MFLKENYKTYDILIRIKNNKMNRMVDDIVKECSQIDSIKDYKIFKNFISKNVKSKDYVGMLSRKEFGSEGLLYGHRNAFFEYAGINSAEQKFLFPYFEHGADLRERGIANVKDIRNHSFVFQASYKNGMVHKERPFAPVYNIGPYILYAKNYYEQNTMADLKSKLGRTALLFPAHTFEGAGVEFDKKKFVKDVLDKFKNNYDSLIISVYWMDVDDPIYEEFEANGAILMSSGFRGDADFIARQRTMFNLSDVVASNLVGSYIGYAKALEKKIYMFSDKAVLDSPENIGTDEQEKQYSNTINRIFNAFSSLTPSAEQLNEQNRIFNYYWGGKEYFKTKEEARTIISLSYKLVKCGAYNTSKIEHVVQRVLKDPNELTGVEYKTLVDAIGAKV